MLLISILTFSLSGCTTLYRADPQLLDVEEPPPSAPLDSESGVIAIDLKLTMEGIDKYVWWGSPYGPVATHVYLVSLDGNEELSGQKQLRSTHVRRVSGHNYLYFFNIRPGRYAAVGCEGRRNGAFASKLSTYISFSDAVVEKSQTVAVPGQVAFMGSYEIHVSTRSGPADFHGTLKDIDRKGMVEFLVNTKQGLRSKSPWYGIIQRKLESAEAN